MSTPASTAVPWCSAPPTRTSRQDGISRTLDLYYRTDKPYEDQGGNYELVTTGASMRFGIPSVRPTPSSLVAAFEQTQIKPGTNIPAAYLAYANTYGFTATLHSPDHWLVARRP
jgi:hypothetical protein